VLEQLGNDVIRFNTYSYERLGGRYLNWLMRKTPVPNPCHYVMNSNLVERSVALKPDVVWIDKGIHITPLSLRKIRASSRAFILSETADNMLIPGNNTKEFTSSIPEYDLMVTDKNMKIVNYYAYGAKKVYSIHKGFYPSIHRPVGLTPKERQLYEADVVFCGTAEEDRANSLAYLVNNGIRVKIWGSVRSWKSMSCFSTLRPYHSRRPVWWDEYAKAINGAKIALCFLRHISGDTQTQRTFELPACGTMTIAERTEDHMKLFEENKEMVFFSDDEELLDKVRYYLSHDKQRQDIAEAGRLRCVNSNYTYAWRYGEILSTIEGLRDFNKHSIPRTNLDMGQS
jgi:glycosyltransferase involved in cell wall biosynthesis